ncbi:MAG: 16S rRNA (cytidine(1402)-2'-O)-methyltransferase [Negativicutes bacterium]|nr:16S rRNA (cytidine(1402)-2'-O)-methyltransferase [Negativicutes bacterium]
MHEERGIGPDRAGTLYVCPTPIGNLQDITFRAVETLRTVSLILAEDTRRTRKLLSHYSIHTPLESFDQRRQADKIPFVIGCLKAGRDVALTCDAGTPAVSDPGSLLVRAVWNNRLRVVPLPGANAATTALSGAGMLGGKFVFLGFLPRAAGRRRELLSRFGSLPAVLVIYESPQRTPATLRAIAETVGDREVAVAREISKIHETYYRGRASVVAGQLAAVRPCGEVVIIVAPPDGEKERLVPAERPEWEVIDRLREVWRATGDMRRTIRQVARDTGLPRAAVYRLFQIEKGEITGVADKHRHNR